MQHRIDCEKCNMAFFDDYDKLHCCLAKCNPEYSDMLELKIDLVRSFNATYDDNKNILIITNTPYITLNLDDCEYPQDVDFEILEWLTRRASQGTWYWNEQKNIEIRNILIHGINNFLNTNFSASDMEYIYSKIGNARNHELTKKFVNSKFNLKSLL